MSKLYYFRNKSLHGLPIISSKAKFVQVGNGASVNILLIIPIIVSIQGHMFKIYTTGFEVHNNVNLVLGVKSLLNWRQK